MRGKLLFIVLLCLPVFLFGAVLINEDFDPYPVSNWTYNSVFKNAGAGIDSTNCAAFNAADDWLQPPAQDRPGKLSFWMATDVSNPEFTFYVQEDTGSGWETVLTITGDQVTTTYAIFTANIMETGNGVSIRFYMHDVTSGKARIDDVYLNDYDEALPIVLSSFTALFAGSTPSIYWTTQSETENAGWHVYRSATGSMTNAILLNSTVIPGAGTSSEPTNYVYTDEEMVTQGSTYWYWIQSIDYAGMDEIYGPVTLTVPMGFQEPNTPDTPQKYGVGNYPNPFNPSTEITFYLKEEIHGSVAVYNHLGQLVKTLKSSVEIPAETSYSLTWDGNDSAGNSVSSGIYFCRVTDGKTMIQHKMVMIK